MKRLLSTACCFLMLIAGAISAWANCERIAFTQLENHDHKQAEPQVTIIIPTQATRPAL